MIVDYAANAISADGTSTSITHSTIKNASSDGIGVFSPIGVPTVSGNNIEHAAGTAIRVESASSTWQPWNGNSGSGNGLNGVQLGCRHRHGQLPRCHGRGTSYRC